MTTKDIGILVGGRSTEFDASIRSYEGVIKSYIAEGRINELKRVIFLNEGRIHMHDPPLPISLNGLTRPDPEPLDHLAQRLQEKGCYWFSLLHGNEGEDGSIQGMADIYDLRGSFGSTFAASVTMSKWATTELATSLTNGRVKSIPGIRLFHDQTPHERYAAAYKFTQKNLADYYVLKPNKLGASLLTEKVAAADLSSRLEGLSSQMAYDSEFLLQSYIRGREFTIGTVHHKDGLQLLPFVEIFTDNNFLGHDEKHKKGKVGVRFGNVEEPLRTRLEDATREIFTGLTLANFARFDYIADGDELYLLEINSIPGLMGSSIFPRMLSEARMTIPQMISLFAHNEPLRLRKSLRYQIEE